MADALGFTFRQDFDAWWPKYDHAPETCFRFVQRGLPDMEIAARHCKRRRIVVQAGAHAGFWPRRLAGLFGKVYAFECEPVLHACAERNLKRWRVPNVTLSSKALGAAVGSAKMSPHRSAGSWSIDPHGTMLVKMTTIDSLDLVVCDAIYLDIEGWEIQALIGAARTIKQFRPIIHLEVLPDNEHATECHMAALGYRRVAAIHKDVVYKSEERIK